MSGMFKYTILLFICLIKLNLIAQTVVWSNDFSNSNDWTISNDPNGNPPHTNGGWIFDVSPSQNLVHMGGFLKELDFYSPSAANGFIKINAPCNGGTQNSSIYFNSTINLSLYPNVYIDFQEFYSDNLIPPINQQNVSSSIIYSIDGGNTWSELLFTNHEFGSLGVTSNPAHAYVDLSGQIGGHSNVKIGFKLTESYCTRAWIIDDVKLITVPNSDVINEEAYVYRNNFNPTLGGLNPTLGVEMRYSKIPKSQLTPFSIKSRLGLLSTQPQNNISSTASLNGVYNSTNANIQLNPFFRDTFTYTSPLVFPNSTGIYTFQCNVNSIQDVNPLNNNILSDPIEITNDVYAFDDGICRRLGYFNNNLAFETGNLFEIFQSSTLNSIQFFVHPSTTIGISYYVKLYKLNNSTGAFDSIGRSSNFIIAPNQLNTFVSVPLTLPLDANENYIATVGSPGTNLPGQGLIIGHSNVESYLSGYFHNYGAQGQGNWYTHFFHPMVRMEIANCQFPTTPSICLTGVDSATNKNRIIWEKPLQSGIDSFFVYKETNVANIYSKIGATDYLDSALFIDVNSNPSVQSERYKIAIFDSCGTVSPLSEPHKTIHLTINQGSGNSYNLIWSHYEGIPFASYNIYRGTSLNNLTLLTTIQSNLNSYTDLNPPLGNVLYQIEIVSPVICDPTKSMDFGSSRSNITDNNFGQLFSMIDNYFSLYPNPANDQITINTDESLMGKEYSILDQVGKLVSKGSLINANTTLSLNNFSNGMYTLQIEGKGRKTFVIQKD